MNWINKIKIEELIQDAPYLKLLENNEHDDDYNVDTLSKFMVSGGPVLVSSEENDENDNRPSKSLFNSVKKEMLEFLCGNSAKYDKLRENLNKNSEQSSKLITPMISVYIASSINTDAGYITGFVALILGVLIQTGKNGFCNYYYE